ncbi:unnamed protein product [Brachionus calyciflorus]|uniref:Uncharacterized protein n=1 Tax=Brachionus calyciflorus TaxID=104777 RepID=A0A813M1P2_9BILA|nr:unnamed protein product [Brachionus calyciflorus]
MYSLNSNHQNLLINQPIYEIETTKQTHNPYCIVIGCKNGEYRSSSTNSVKFYPLPSLATSNSIARQWYINTLREDLLENILQTKQSNQHFVCIEHFDEESFLQAKDPCNPSSLIMILKDDAVPSLFEIEVFQKMIAHQEQFTLNQQKISIQTKPFTTNAPITSNQINRPKNKLLQNLILNAEAQQNLSNQQQQQSASNIQKRTRIDPDTRAALIQRVPKAVKRTAVFNLPKQVIPDVNPNSPKLQKAIKHTFPRQQQIQQQTQSQNQFNTENNKNQKIQKAVKHPSSAIVNSILKDILPPPIMQSTKRPNNNNNNNSMIAQNRAVKHTTPIVTSTTSIVANKQPLSQVNQNSQSNNQPITTTSGNKITITTTYVYKRVLQPPEIDLNLECEEEELVYVKAPPKEIPKIEEPKILVKTEKKEIKEAKNEGELKEKESEKPKVQNKKDVKAPTGSHTVKIISKEDKEIKDQDQKLNTKPKQTAKSTNNQPAKPVNNQSIENKNESVNNNNNKNNVNNNYINELGKYYSRRLGAIKASMEDIKNSNNKKTKNTYLPLDLRPGNYPAKCNICDLILENNIELTSHICSHLESNDLSTEQNTYISPFDAVTTTCGVCDTQFENPYLLIKHLDSSHMKQLAEYKCRICEKQHDKLSELIDHLNKNHSEQEMPYRCDACGFRTSFYADAIYHIKKEHTNTLRHFCPYCLKSLVLPFNKKLGHVQCNIFYSHLITHFNKHENDEMIPSKCKHCTKCILHIRHMKEHLIFDHNSIVTAASAAESLEERTSDEEKKEDYEDKIELDLTSNEKDLKRRSVNNNNNKVTKNESESKTTNPQMSLRKRKRSFNEQKSDSENENSESDSVKIDPIEKDKNETTEQVKLDESLKEKIKNENSLAKIRTKRRTSEYSNLIKKAQSIKSAKNEFTDQVVKIEQVLKQEPVETPMTPEPEVVYKKKQKALKQTNIRPHMQRRRFRSSNYALEKDRSPSCSPNSASSQKVSTLIFGNVKFNCIKNEFKCVECGEKDLKSHYRTDYECHQCKYNTGCSKSFEFHLHGHLVRKRVALWNKSQQIELQEYKCPCGFTLNSEKDNKSKSNTGNKVAEHLLNCEYKYCYYNSALENDVEENCSQSETIQNNLGNLDEKQLVSSRERFNNSDEIILDDSNDEIAEI